MVAVTAAGVYKSLLYAFLRRSPPSVSLPRVTPCSLSFPIYKTLVQIKKKKKRRYTGVCRAIRVSFGRPIEKSRKLVSDTDLQHVLRYVIGYNVRTIASQKSYQKHATTMRSGQLQRAVENIGFIIIMLL